MEATQRRAGSGSEAGLAGGPGVEPAREVRHGMTAEALSDGAAASPRPDAERLHRFQTLEEARGVIAPFITRYNREWLIERLGYRTPAQDRAEGWRAGA